MTDPSSSTPTPTRYDGLLAAMPAPLVGGAAALLVINARLTLVMLAVVPAVIIGGAAFGRRLRRLSRDFQDRVADANADAEEAIANVRIVQSFTGEDVERDRYAAGIQRAWRLARRRVRAGEVWTASIRAGMSCAASAVSTTSAFHRATYASEAC